MDTSARQRGFEIKVFPLIGELPKAIEPHLPFCQLYRWQLGPNMWSSPTTKSLNPIVVTALRVGFPGESHRPATCEFACNCPEPEAWTMEASGLFSSTHDVTSHLQRIQNYTARVISRLPKSSHITTHLKSLHWLPVKVGSTYKIVCLCYHCHSSTAPSYVADMLHKNPSHTFSSSYTMPLLNRPAHSKGSLGDRSFSSSV